MQMEMRAYVYVERGEYLASVFLGAPEISSLGFRGLLRGTSATSRTNRLLIGLISLTLKCCADIAVASCNNNDVFIVGKIHFLHKHMIEKPLILH